MPRKISTQELEGTRRRGRPRKGWREEVERDLQVLGVRRWRELVIDREKWRGIVRQAKAHSGLQRQWKRKKSRYKACSISMVPWPLISVLIKHFIFWQQTAYVGGVTRNTQYKSPSVRFSSGDKLMCNGNDIGNLVLLRNLQYDSVFTGEPYISTNEIHLHFLFLCST